MWFGFVHGRKCYFIEPHPADRFFGRDRLYGHWDDIERFSAFSKADIRRDRRAVPELTGAPRVPPPRGGRTRA